MTEWLVRLKGHEFDLGELSDHFASAKCNVKKDDDGVIKSFRNIPRVLVITPAELEVAAIVWARSLLVSESALEEVQKRGAA